MSMSMSTSDPDEADPASSPLGCPFTRPPAGLTIAQEEDVRQKILEELPFAILGTDAAGNIAIVNKQTEALFGWSRHDILGQPVEVLIPARFHAQHVQYRQAFLEDPKIREMGAAVPLVGLHRNEREIPLRIWLAWITIAGAGILPVVAIQKVSGGATP